MRNSIWTLENRLWQERIENQGRTLGKYKSILYANIVSNHFNEIQASWQNNVTG